MTTATQQVLAPKKARIEIIPLIDVIFFLLATFVLFTLSLNKIQNVTVELPQATPNQPASKTDSEIVVLQLSDTGSAFWNKEPIAANEIRPRLINYKTSTTAPKVLVTGDDNATYGDVVRALDEVRLAGITEVSIETNYRGSGK
ncbi:MAG: biopolymer transporter ExbD [Puniceicoccales bacterium]|jgi:biopolymer transport protein ExbD|nr:biopolymer transporter ExbD [Puniceicoccales bacterium]